jgi:hypothetical protein
MSYWSKSFGFYLTIAASIFYAFLVGIFALIDHYTIPRVVDRVFARVKRLELKGFKQKEDARKMTVFRDDKGKIVFIKHSGTKLDKDDIAEEAL